MIEILKKIFGKKKNNADGAGTTSEADDRQRLKKIKKMTSKFDETVWNSVLDIMRTEIPQFVITEPDPDLEGMQISKYVLLGFDTTIVDDFSNKADDDIGSIMKAITSSMDCIIEEGLLAEELILMIPTAKTLTALKEFEESFDLYFYIAYVTDSHGVSIEARPGCENEYLSVRLPDIEKMLAEGTYIGDMIESLKADGAANIPDDDDITAPERYDDDIPDEDGIPDEGGIRDEDPQPDPESDNSDPDGNRDDPDNGTENGRDSDETKKAIDKAVQDASRVAGQVSNQRDEAKDAGSKKPEQAGDNGGGDGNNGNNGNSGDGAAAEAAEKMTKLKSAVQKASDDALGDAAVKNAQANINPQARMRTFDMAAMDQYVTRKYYSDDLGLEVTSEPFDAMFMQSNPYVPFKELDDDTWLSGYVNNLRRDANTRLEKLHQENIMLMRERYMLIIMKHCESITKSVSTDDPNSRFGYALRGIKQLHDDDVAKISERAEAYKRECEQAYQDRMETAAKNAAAAARTNFENTHRAEHERELREIETDLRNNIESEYVMNVENLKAERRNEAKRQLDVGISEALKLCGDEYTKMIAMERREYVRIQAVITDFQNDNMVNEQARIIALAEEQRRENEVVKVRREYDSKYELASREFEAKLASAKADMERAGIEHAKYVSELREQHENMMQGLRDAQMEQIAHKDAEIQTLKSQLDTANEQVKMLTEKYVELDEKAGQKYAGVIDKLRGERDAWTERSEQVERLHKYTDKIKLTTMLIAIIAALGLGIIFGCAIVANTYNNQEKAPIINYIDKNGGSGPQGGESPENTAESDQGDNADRRTSDERYH